MPVANVPNVHVRIAAAVLGGVVLASCTARAQEVTGSGTTALQAVDPEQKVRAKEPPPPLFPRHGRGIYRNAEGVDVIDATPQSPPLTTDDPGVPGKDQYEINLLTQADYAHAAQRLDLLVVDANYGLRPVLFGYHLPTQIKLEAPLAATRVSGQPFDVGMGTAAMGAKFNFYDDEHRGISVAVYPQVEFPTPGGRGVAKGLSDAGQTIVLPLLVAREFREFTLVFNAGVQKPIHDADRSTTSDFGIAFGRAVTRKDAVMFELRTESSLNFRSDGLVFLNAGYIHGVRHIVVYGNAGRSLFAENGLAHTYAGIGIKLQVHTARNSAAPRSIQ